MCRWQEVCCSLQTECAVCKLNGSDLQTEPTGMQTERSMKQFANRMHRSANWTGEYMQTGRASLQTVGRTADLRTLVQQAAHVLKVDVLRAFDVLAGDAGELTH